MNYFPFVDANDTENLIKLSKVMKDFIHTFSDHKLNEELKDIFDVQVIMEEGRIDDLIKYIRSILQYDPDVHPDNNSLTVFNSSFIKFFRISQLVIQFLLYWKSELMKENVKLKTEYQELEKTRAKKLDIKDLKKQLLSLTSTDKLNEFAASECAYCKKTFASSAFLLAHHKRRHTDVPFHTTKTENEVKKLQNEINVLKSQLNGITKMDQDKNEKKKKKDIIPLKMRLNPEPSCLEAQEKFWKGRIKELSDKFAQEKQEMEAALEKCNLENEQLRTNLNDNKNILKTTKITQTDPPENAKENVKHVIMEDKQTKCVQTDPTEMQHQQTETSTLNELKVFTQELNKIRAITENVFSNLERNPSSESSPQTVTDSKELNSVEDLLPVIPNVEDANSTDDFKNAITKLFPCNEESDSSKLADKLIRLYEKRRSSVPQIAEDEENGKSKISNSENNEGCHLQTSEPIEESVPSASVRDDSVTGVEKDQTDSKNEKHKFLTNLRNIRMKTVKTFVKIRKSCKDIKQEKNKKKLQTELALKDTNSTNHHGNDSIHSIFVDNEPSHKPKGKSEEEVKALKFVEKNPFQAEEKKLTSAMKKAKSTGNIVKKVAFADNLPTLKVASESNLRELVSLDTKNEIEHANSVKIGSIHVHYDRFARPIPAPRTKKNVVISNLTDSQSTDELAERN